MVNVLQPDFITGAQLPLPEGFEHKTFGPALYRQGFFIRHFKAGFYRCSSKTGFNFVLVANGGARHIKNNQFNWILHHAKVCVMLCPAKPSPEVIPLPPIPVKI